MFERFMQFAWIVISNDYHLSFILKYVATKKTTKSRLFNKKSLKSRLFATMAGGMAGTGRTFVKHAMMGLEKGCLAGRPWKVRPTTTYSRHVDTFWIHIYKGKFFQYQLILFIVYLLHSAISLCSRDWGTPILFVSVTPVKL